MIDLKKIKNLTSKNVLKNLNLIIQILMKKSHIKIKSLTLKKNLKIEKDLKIFLLKDIKRVINYFNFHVTIGTKVAAIKEQNNND